MKRLVLLLLTLSGCQVVAGLEDFTGVSCQGQAPTEACGKCGTRTASCDEHTSTWTSGSTSCTGEGVCLAGATQACTTGSDPSMQTCSSSCQWGSCGPRLTPLTMVPRPDGTGTFGIEQHEVTREQYAQFLQAPASDIAAAIGTPRAGCDATQNPSYEPDATCMKEPTVCTKSCNRHPQVCVDWCDAYAYCKWIGRRLCGKIGGGPSDINEYNSLTMSQWTAACVGTQGRVDVFPYGPEPKEGICNDGSNGCTNLNTCTVEVGQESKCHAASSPYDTVLDLSGNVAEWEDACDLVTPQTTRCQVRGGSYYDYPDRLTTSLQCSGNSQARFETNAAYEYIGVRCCAD